MNYTATVTREGDTWLADVDGMPGAHTYARNLSTLARNITEVIRLITDDDTEQVVVTCRYPDLDEDAAAAVELASERDELDRRRNELNAATVRSVRRLVEQGYSVRDVAGLLHLTPGRVSQITRGRALQDA